jgi:two-component system, NarL family, sensor histidine kinase BarA
MHSSVASESLDPLGSAVSLAQLLDAQGLEDILQSFYALFRIPIRVLGEDGDSVARSRKPTPLNDYLGELPVARQRLAELHQLLRTQEADESGEFLHAAFTGASYHVAMIGHDGRCIGRFILGPFITPAVREAPASLGDADPRMDRERAAELLLALPRVRQDTVKAIARHLAVVLDVLIYSGHRALLSEYMHLSTVQENRRQLSARDQGLLAAEQRLAESGRVQAHFLVTALSALEAPLETILGHSEALTRSEHVPVEQRDVVLGIRQRAAQLLGLSNRLLDFSKVDSGSLALECAAVDICPLIERVASRLRALAPERAHDISVRCAAGLPPLWADAGSLEQVLMLVGENALRFALEGEISIVAARVVDSAGDDADGMVLLGGPPERLELRVSDRGIGIPDAEKARVFEPFYQPPRADGAGAPSSGVGLGLAIAKRLVKAQGGSIVVEDNSPRGTLVVVSLPLSPSPP